jgi:ADP-dependent NAD(P)H-hydrate dehydratase / NAD(P)H-hydrate epimerase
VSLAEDGPTTALEMAVFERNAAALGVSVDVLMENAGRAVAEEAARHLPAPPARVAVLLGTGNNGGDGSVAAFYLGQWGYAPELWPVRPAAEIRGAAARRSYDRAAAKFPVRTGRPRPSELSDFPLLIDALLGTGQSGPLRPPYLEVAEVLNESGVPVLSVDEPTGLGGTVAVHPKWTVALTAIKEGMSPETCGEITLRDVGIPIDARRCTGPGEFLYYPLPSRADTYPRPGRIVVIGGGPYAGAPALAALAALRAGVERATVLAPLPAANRVQSFSMDLVVHPVGADHFQPADVATIETWLDSTPADAIVVGMGVGRAESTLAALRELLPRLAARAPLVVDADALDALPATMSEAPASHPVIATPNQAEFARVFEGAPVPTHDEQLEEVRRRASARRLTLLVKGSADLFSDARSSGMNLHHPAALAVSGAGDVLGGLLGSLLARRVAPIPAARLATYWLGAAGHRAFSRHGPGLLASDLVDELPAALLEGLERVGRRADSSATRAG